MRNYVYMYIFSFKKKSNVVLTINNTTVIVKYGDLFEETCGKVIGVNEYFDTLVDEDIVSSNSLHGQVIKKYYNDIKALDKKIENDDNLKNNIYEINDKRKNIKNIKYNLGTIFKDKDFYFLALTKFSDDNKAYLYLNDYTLCLLKMWNELNRSYNREPIALPILGSGITRIKDKISITEQELLEIMIWTLKISQVKFSYPSEIHIIIRNDLKNKINLNKLKNI